MNKKVFVSGCYDLLHSGHVEFFRQAAAYGDLYVGIGSDDTILKYKKWKIYFENKGTNDYCLVINNKAFSFATYGSVTSCLELLEYMFSKALEERKK